MLHMIKKNIFRKLRYFANTSGAIAIMFGLTAPVIVGAAGFAVDFAAAYLVKQRLASAIDAAALAGAASSDNAAEIEQKVKEFFDVNYPPDKVGFTFEPKVNVTSSEVQVTGTATYKTKFLNILSIFNSNADKIDIEAYTVVSREVRAVEVVLVLDNTGSMSTNNNISKLKKASKNFVDIMFDATSNDNLVKIGLVPYANSVRPGSYALGKYPDGSEYDGGYTFVDLPDGMTFTNNHNTTNRNQWFGCVIEHNEDGWDLEYLRNDPYPSDVFDDYEGPWEMYRYSRLYNVDSRYRDWPGYFVYNGNHYLLYEQDQHATNCPYSQIVPLTSDRDKLLDAIGDPDVNNDGMRAHGNTLGNVGLAWGARVISPERPFPEGAEWDNYYWKKAIIMMTDGVNTRDSYYSAYWSAAHNNIGTGDYNNRFSESCEDLKEKGIIIYTVTFSTGANSAKDLYKQCASSEDKYKHTDDPDELVAVFEGIARELSILHISQ